MFFIKTVNRRLLKCILFNVLFLLMLAGCVSSGTAGKPGAPEEGVIVGKAYSQGIKNDYLAGTHIKNEYVSGCSDCHGNTVDVDDSETELNNNCRKCHGTYDEFKTKIKQEQKEHKGPKKVSGHEGHLIDVSCTACHSGHSGSFPYCNYCHSFDMKIPFAKAKTPYVPENLSYYYDKEPNHVETADVLVIGSGGSGLMAAGVAANAGKKVIIVEKMPVIGGSSILSTGGMNAAGTKIQHEKGVMNDSPEVMVKDTLAIGKTNDVALVRILAERSNDALEWFINAGAHLTLNPKVKTGGTTVPRSHYTETGAIGQYMIPILLKELRKSGTDVRTNSKAVMLKTDANGRVTGALIYGKHSGLYEVKAGATILATGSYANNQALVTQYNPQLKGIITTAQPGSHGDGVVMAERIGAKAINMGNVQIHPNAAAGTSIMVTQNMRIGGGILVNRSGKRFMDDLAPRNKMGEEILKQEGQAVYLIYDDNVAKLRKKVHEGYIHLNFVTTASTPDELAKKLGLPVDAFVDTMKSYAQFYKNQKDTDFNRPTISEPLTNGNLYAIEVIPGIGGTLGGVAVNTKMQVLDENNQPIKGLYASGEVVGGWHGEDRYGGNAVAGNLVFGRLSAESAMESLGK